MPLLEKFPKDSVSYHRAACASGFAVALFVIARPCSQPSCPPTEEWVREMQFIYTKGFYSAVNKNESCAWN